MTAETLVRPTLQLSDTAHAAQIDVAATEPTRGWLRRTTKHPTVMPYCRLVAVVVACNTAVAVWGVVGGGWQIADGNALDALSALAVVNIAVAVGVRQQPFLNLIYGLVGRGCNTSPLWARWSLSKIHHIGGIHAGAAITATGWTCAFAVAAFVAHRSPHAIDPASES